MVGGGAIGGPGLQPGGRDQGADGPGDGRARLGVGYLPQEASIFRKLSVQDNVQLALRYGELDDSRLVARRLLTTRRVVCAAPAYLARHGAPQHPGELVRHECLSFMIRGRRVLQWPFERNDGQETLSVRVQGRRSADDAEIAHRWALAGHGILCKSEIDVHAHLASGALVRLLPDWQGITMPLHAVLPSNRFVPARVRALVDTLARRFEASGMGLPAPLTHAGGPASLPSSP